MGKLDCPHLMLSTRRPIILSSSHLSNSSHPCRLSHRLSTCKSSVSHAFPVSHYTFQVSLFPTKSSSRRPARSGTVRSQGCRHKFKMSSDLRSSQQVISPRRPQDFASHAPRSPIIPQGLGYVFQRRGVLLDGRQHHILVSLPWEPLQAETKRAANLQVATLSFAPCKLGMRHPLHRRGGATPPFLHMFKSILPHPTPCGFPLKAGVCLDDGCSTY